MVNGTTTHTYVTQTGKVVRETISTSSTTKVLDFIYDNNGQPFALKYSTNGGANFATYYYVLNLQGDVVMPVNAAGKTKATYRYNAWGALVYSSGDMATVNPLRYRGYYYDTETGFYYLQSRYYDPAICRFINADSYTSTGTGFLGHNMFAYCNNNPINYSDSSGHVLRPIAITRYDTIAFAIRFDEEDGDGVSNGLIESIATNMANNASLTEDQKVLIATIAAEGTVTAQNKLVSSEARQAMANVALNRVGSREWSNYKSVADVCRYSGFDGYGDGNYDACMGYLNNRDGSNAIYEMIILDVMKAYCYDITKGCQLYYTPATMSPPGSAPSGWTFSYIEEVIISGVDTYYEGHFYRYR